MLKVFLCAAGLSLFATGCSFATEEFRTIPTERTSDESSGSDGDAASDAAPASNDADDDKGDDEGKKRKSKEDD